MSVTIVRLSAPPLTEWRCPKCGALLARIRLSTGSVIEVRCWRCKATIKEAA